MDLNVLSGVVVDLSVQIHRATGPGMYEVVYHRILAYELRKAGYEVESEKPVPLEWDGHIIDESFRSDIIVNKTLLLELKSVETILPVHKKQVLTYLKLLGLPLGLLINFGSPLLKDGIYRIVNNLPES